MIAIIPLLMPRSSQMSMCSLVWGITDSSRGHDEEHHVDAPCPRHHVPDEPLMARDIDDADEDIVSEAVVGKSELDSNAPLFFLFEPVAVDAGKGLDERRLPVIDMARGAYHHLFHGQIIL